MTGVIEQRLCEAAKAQLGGRVVHFGIQEGGAGRQFVAMYPSGDFVRDSRHVIFTGGSGPAFARLAEECRKFFDGLVADARVCSMRH